MSPVAVFLSVLVGCAPAVDSFQPAKLEPALKQVVRQQPDSVVAVLIRLTRDVEVADSAALAETGFAMGSARGRIITGKARARVLRTLTNWSQIEWIELSAMIPTTPRGELPAP